MEVLIELCLLIIFITSEIYFFPLEDVLFSLKTVANIL